VYLTKKTNKQLELGTNGILPGKESPFTVKMDLLIPAKILNSTEK